MARAWCMGWMWSVGVIPVIIRDTRCKIAYAEVIAQDVSCSHIPLSLVVTSERSVTVDNKVLNELFFKRQSMHTWKTTDGVENKSLPIPIATYTSKTSPLFPAAFTKVFTCVQRRVVGPLFPAPLIVFVGPTRQRPVPTAAGAPDAALFRVALCRENSRCYCCRRLPSGVRFLCAVTGLFEGYRADVC